MMATASLVQAQMARKVTGTVTSAEDGSPLPGVTVTVKNTSVGTVTATDGKYKIEVSGKNDILVFSFIGLLTQEVKVGSRTVVDVQMKSDVQHLQEVVVVAQGAQRTKKAMTGSSAIYGSRAPAADTYLMAEYEADYDMQYNTEEYDAISENTFREALKKPLSTFSIDVDAASYSNVRRFLNNGQRPPIDAVRIEEMINYFSYDYAEPMGEDPFSINAEVAAAPWNSKHKLVHIGLQGKNIPTENLPASNLVFLLDVSGSMNAANKLPLLKSAFNLLVEQLRPEDRVAIVVYAGAAGVVLPSTSGKEKNKILSALDQLSAGGSTAGGAGIQLAYKIAQENFVEEGNNRIILATDGDFNVGASSNAEMERMIEKEREKGTFLTVLGFGMGNYKDSKMEILADKGNGNYAYIDNMTEAKKVLVNEFGGTLFTIAKDVKIQVEFNPVQVQSYRLIGYENRLLKDEDFNNDKKDAGELGAGHTVTALYEIIPVGVKSEFQPIDDLKYQEKTQLSNAANSDELLTVKLRYKSPRGSKSKLIESVIMDTDIKETSNNFRWSAAVASFGMLLRNSEFIGDFTMEDAIRLARGAKGKDEEGYRIELIRLMESSRLLARR